MMQDAPDPLGSQNPYIGHRATITSGQQSERDESKHYRLVARVGEGGFGTVYRAEDTFFNNRPVAIKSINLTGLTTPQIIEATDGFKREVMLLSGLAQSIHTSTLVRAIPPKLMLFPGATWSSLFLAERIHTLNHGAHRIHRQRR